MRVTNLTPYWVQKVSLVESRFNFPVPPFNLISGICMPKYSKQANSRRKDRGRVRTLGMRLKKVQLQKCKA